MIHCSNAHIQLFNKKANQTILLIFKRRFNPLRCCYIDFMIVVNEVIRRVWISRGCIRCYLCFFFLHKFFILQIIIINIGMIIANIFRGVVVVGKCRIYGIFWNGVILCRILGVILRCSIRRKIAVTPVLMRFVGFVGGYQRGGY